MGQFGDYHYIWVVGEPEFGAGSVYRCHRMAAAANLAGLPSIVLTLDQAVASAPDLWSEDGVVVLWRAAWDERVAKVVDAVRGAGGRLVYDVDDLMFESDLAVASEIDAIRSQGLDPTSVRAHFHRAAMVVDACDACIAPTEALADRLRLHKPCFVVPNGFDRIALALSATERRRARVRTDRNVIRVGYAAGTSTHQADFATCADPLADVMAANRQSRLVLFTDAAGTPTVDLSPFSKFDSLRDQVEHRQAVPFDLLPAELARLDICIAPLATDKAFNRAKSEIKFLESALVGVPCIASPTPPFRSAIRHGEDGFLAFDESDWSAALEQLIESRDLRQRVGDRAHLNVLWRYGAERRGQLLATIWDQVQKTPTAAVGFSTYLQQQRIPEPPDPVLPTTSKLVRSFDRLVSSDVTVVVTVHNYEKVLCDALDSVAEQTLRELDLVIVDDASSDGSLDVAIAWVEANKSRFHRVLVYANAANQGLARTRNWGFLAADTEFVFVLDADNRLLPDCLAQARAQLITGNAAFAYPVIRRFGDHSGLMGTVEFDPNLLIQGNYIDAMALVRRSVWAMLGGYAANLKGWEDYDLWCGLAECGLYGVRISANPLAEYRVHGRSMIHTDAPHESDEVRRLFKQRHPWVTLGDQGARTPAKSPRAPRMQTPQAARIEEVLMCPLTHAPLTRIGDDRLASAADGTEWRVVRGVPVLAPGMDEPTIVDQGHVSNALPSHVLDRIRSTRGLVLNLAAGTTGEKLPNVVEAEHQLFATTDVIVDAHRLPFRDASFDGVVALNAFEHFADPPAVANEIHRVLRPGGWVLIHTAFMQPAHEVPHHFFNCTRHGLELWFQRFSGVDIRVPENFNPAYALSWMASELESSIRRDVSPSAADAFSATSTGTFAEYWRDPASRTGPLWESFADLPPAAQERLSAGFELTAIKQGGQ